MLRKLIRSWIDKNCWFDSVTVIKYWTKERSGVWALLNWLVYIYFWKIEKDHQFCDEKAECYHLDLPPSLLSISLLWNQGVLYSLCNIVNGLAIKICIFHLFWSKRVLSKIWYAKTIDQSNQTFVQEMYFLPVHLQRPGRLRRRLRRANVQRLRKGAYRFLLKGTMRISKLKFIFWAEAKNSYLLFCKFAFQLWFVW